MRFLLLALSVSCFIKYNIPSELTTAPKRISFDAWGTKTNSHSFMCKIQLYVALNQRQCTVALNCTPLPEDMAVLWSSPSLTLPLPSSYWMAILPGYCLGSSCLCSHDLYFVNNGFRGSASDTGCLGNRHELQGSHPGIPRGSSHTVTRGVSSVHGDIWGENHFSCRTLFKGVFD